MPPVTQLPDWHWPSLVQPGAPLGSFGRQKAPPMRGCEKQAWLDAQLLSAEQRVGMATSWPLRSITVRKVREPRGICRAWHGRARRGRGLGGLQSTCAAHGLGGVPLAAPRHAASRQRGCVWGMGLGTAGQARLTVRYTPTTALEEALTPASLRRLATCGGAGAREQPGATWYASLRSKQKASGGEVWQARTPGG